MKDQTPVPASAFVILAVTCLVGFWGADRDIRKVKATLENVENQMSMCWLMMTNTPIQITNNTPIFTSVTNWAEVTNWIGNTIHVSPPITNIVVFYRDGTNVLEVHADGAILYRGRKVYQLLEDDVKIIQDAFSGK